MSTLTIQGTVTDALGTVFTYNTTATADTLTATATVNPASAGSGTTRTLTVNAVSSTGSVITFGTPTATGITFTAVSGQPAGQAQWTFVY